MEDSFHRWPASQSVLWSRIFGHKVYGCLKFVIKTFLHPLPKEDLTAFLIRGNVCPTLKVTATFTTRLPGRHAQRRPLKRTLRRSAT